MNDIIAYDLNRYVDWNLDSIGEALRGSTLGLLKRGSLAALIARREWGGLFVAASKLVASLSDQTGWFRRILNLDYADARRHMKLWVFWPRVEAMLREREAYCRSRDLPFVVPGYRHCLRLAGITGRMGPAIPLDPAPAPVVREPLPTDVAALTERVELLELQNRLEMERVCRLTVELDLTREELDSYKAKEPTGCWASSLTGWIGAKLPRQLLRPRKPERPAAIEVRIGDCLDQIEPDENVYDAIVTDPPYAIGLHGYAWDSTDLSFSPELWQRLYRALKPGGYIALFAAPRLYHRAAVACEQQGFVLYPFLGWRFRQGLPKPINLSELFDRDKATDRAVIGVRRGSGFTRSNVDHGAQNRSHFNFASRLRHVSPEAQTWKGYYYGVNTLRPTLEPILLAQKPISTRRVIDNVRQWGTGALNVGALNERYGFWPSTLFTHSKAHKADHQSNHPSVKPTPLMEDLCLLVCPTGGRILDPFAGTGTTGVAARNQNFDCVLIEQNSAMREVIERRLRG